MTQPSPLGLQLGKLHRGAGEAATTVPLANPNFVHPQDTAELLFALGQPQLPDTLAVGLDHEDQLLWRRLTARKELGNSRIGLHPRSPGIHASVRDQLLRVSDLHARQPGIELGIGHRAKRDAHDTEL